MWYLVHVTPNRLIGDYARAIYDRVALKGCYAYEGANEPVSTPI